MAMVFVENSSGISTSSLGPGSASPLQFAASPHTDASASPSHVTTAKRHLSSNGSRKRERRFWRSRPCFVQPPSRSSLRNRRVLKVVVLTRARGDARARTVRGHKLRAKFPHTYNRTRTLETLIDDFRFPKNGVQSVCSQLVTEVPKNEQPLEIPSTMSSRANA